MTAAVLGVVITVHQDLVVGVVGVAIVHSALSVDLRVDMSSTNMRQLGLRSDFALGKSALTGSSYVSHVQRWNHILTYFARPRPFALPATLRFLNIAHDPFPVDQRAVINVPIG